MSQVTDAPVSRNARGDQEAAASTKKLSRRLTLTALATAVGVVAAAIGLAFDLHPAWRPDPGTQLDATMNAGPMETNVALGDYLNRTGQKPDAAQRTVLKVWGDVFYVRQQTDGLKHQGSTLTWHIYDASSRRRVASEDALLGHAIRRSSTPSDTIIVPIWMQPPTDRGSYFLRFELYAKGVLLAMTDSPTFRYCSSTRCGAPPPHNVHRG